MSIARDMRTFMLQKKSVSRGPSGAKKEVWDNRDEIRVAIYKSDEKIMAASEKYKDATHIGLTYCKSIEAGKYRLKLGEHLFYVQKSDSSHRLTNLILKEVDADV